MFSKRKLLAFTITIFFSLSFILTQSVQASSVFVFNKNLRTGNANTEVKELQRFLNNNGFVLNKFGFGSLGRETTFFGSATRNALIKFQKANKITPAVGYFGPISRSAVNKIVKLSATVSSPSSHQAGDNQPVNQVNSQSNQNIKSDYYTVGGSITGIVDAVVLQNNGEDDLTIDIGQNSNFTFSTAIADDANYSVTVKPKYLGQTCYVNDNIGVIDGANIKNIKIACGANLSYDPFTFVFSGGVASYSLTYTVGADGTISGATSQTVNSGSSGSAVTAVPDTGYSFVSWSDGILTAERTDSSVTANKSVSATFAINTYTVTFDTNGGDGGSTAAQTLDYDTPTVLTTNGFTKIGYTFAGWATTSGGAVAYANGANYTIGAADVTLYAKWTAASQALTFESNDGSAVTAITQDYGTSISAPAAPTKPDYTFADWYNEVGLSTIHTFNTMGLSTTVYAKWNAALSIGMDYQGGKIAYLDGTGHGIIAATADQSIGIIWAVTAYQSTSVPGGTSAAIGTGSANTDKIITQNTAGSTYAAGLAGAYIVGIYDDWYLPSKDELAQLYLNRVAIGNFASSHYWSSSEGASTGAYRQTFTEIGGQGNDSKSGARYVRAVRAF